MSEIKTLDVEVDFPDRLDVDVDFGQTLTKIVAPEHYMGPFEFYPSDKDQVIPVKEKTPVEDICVKGITGEKTITSNGTYNTLEDKAVTVDVNPDLRPLSVSESGTYEPDGFDGYKSVVVDVPTGGFPSYDDVVLPSEYQKVEYIKSSGTQFINLPYGFDVTDVISMRSSIDTSMGGDKFMTCPSMWNNDNNRFGLCGLAAQKYFIFAYGAISTGDSFFASRYSNDGNLHDFYYSEEMFYIVDLKRVGGVADATFGAESYPLRLFYGYNANTNGKIAYFVHTKADNRKIALFACYRKSDGVIGMYDVENDVFYTNDGTGDFTKGQDI